MDTSTLTLGLLSILRAMLLFSLISLISCSQTSPRDEEALAGFPDGLSGNDIFLITFESHGGRSISQLQDVNIAVDGKWRFLITKIQPDLTDETFRQQSEERFLLPTPLYASHYSGDAGSKQVRWYNNQIQVAYHESAINDTHKASAAALTADAFYIFSLGPLALQQRVSQWTRLDDMVIDRVTYYRINGELKPGVGLSEADYITVWVNKETGLSYRLHFTLDGFAPTRGAHIDTTYLAYTKVQEFTLPTHFKERVRGPFKLEVHEWWYTGLDINRGLGPDDLPLIEWSPLAKKPASPITPAKKKPKNSQ